MTTAARAPERYGGGNDGAGNLASPANGGTVQGTLAALAGAKRIDAMQLPERSNDGLLSRLAGQAVLVADHPSPGFTVHEVEMPAADWGTTTVSTYLGGVTAAATTLASIPSQMVTTALASLAGGSVETGRIAGWINANAPVTVNDASGAYPYSAFADWFAPAAFSVPSPGSAMAPEIGIDVAALLGGLQSSVQQLTDELAELRKSRIALPDGGPAPYVTAESRRNLIDRRSNQILILLALFSLIAQICALLLAAQPGK